ncbi:MAG: methyltransferase [Oscillospiraceae bacterium]|nr:methyltransferase [Oscillospiraceae bacterium]
MDTLIETFYDAYLNISTYREPSDDIKENEHDNIYEATSYFFLERLFQIFPFAEDDHLVDFGCGKGRVLFMAAKHSCPRVTGYENNQQRYQVLQKNVAQYQQEHGSDTVFNVRRIDAQSADIDDSANKFFFFEPFHLSIYKKVTQNIIKSLEHKPREATIMLYLPHESTIEYYDTLKAFRKEIHVDSSLYYLGETLFTMPHFAFYANHSMVGSVDPYLIMY